MARSGRSLRWLSVLVTGLLPLLSGPVCAVTVEQIPSPRPAGWTVDLTGSLTPETVEALNRLGDEVKAQTGGEIAVVVVGTIEGAPSREFATRLANTWGIGDAEADNGILLFAALDDRTAELVLGTGIDTEETRRISEEIMQGEIVPRFRAGDVSGAFYQGALAAARRILGASPASVVQEPTVTPQPADVLPPPASPAETPALPAYEAPSSEPDFRPSRGLSPGGLFLGLFALFAGAITYFKLVPPRCRECKTRMERLSESGDDLHLEPGEQTEERIGSVNYDIWICQTCGKMVKRRWTSWGSGRSTCPKCQARTVGRETTVLEEATYSHSGQVRVTDSCAHCDYTYSYTYTTPQLEERRDDDDDNSYARSSSSSSHSSFSSYSSSSSSSSDSSSSSSSSSSSGFGGGSSSGGGASGKW